MPKWEGVEGGDEGWKREEGFSDEARRGKIPHEGGRVTSQSQSKRKGTANREERPIEKER
jgi:hypothetical protein